MSDSPKWGSCKTISSNLVQSYMKAFGSNLEFFRFDTSFNLADTWRLAGEIHDYSPERIVFLDHLPHPLALLQAVKFNYGVEMLPDMVFHVYGDFTLYPAAWLTTGGVLKDARSLFICASEKQKRLVANLMAMGTQMLEVVPFPVSEELFYLSADLRKAWRKKLGLEAKDKVFLYTGRMSIQKNISLLVEEFAQFAKSRPDVQLILAGNFDDLGAPLFGWNPPLGEYELSIQNELKSLPANIRSRIKFTGSVKQDDLNGLYNAADAFISLSLHHDEDYGMSLAEALVTGLPLCVTEWGGYSSFLDEEDNGVGINVELGALGLKIDRVEIRDAMESVLSMMGSGADRTDRAKRSTARFSVKTGAEALLQVHDSEIPVFSGFSHNLSNLAFHFTSGIPFPEGPVKNNFYEGIYAAYQQN